MLKIEKDILDEINPTIIEVANELIRRSTTDSTLHEALNKPHKSLKGMLKYIRSKALKQAVDGVAYIHDDKIVYGWAQHYYDEDDIMPVEKKKSAETVIAKDVELPEETLDDFDL